MTQIIHCSEEMVTLGTRVRLLSQVTQGVRLRHTGGRKCLLTVRARETASRSWAATAAALEKNLPQCEHMYGLGLSKELITVTTS